jgi:hypothetical protein
MMNSKPPIPTTHGKTAITHDGSFEINHIISGSFFSVHRAGTVQHQFYGAAVWLVTVG